MQRELAEEVIIDTPFTHQQVGLINDDHNDVGKVHLGIVHLFTVDQPNVTNRETEIIDSGFQTVQELLNEIDEFETWSQICLRAIFE